MWRKTHAGATRFQRANAPVERIDQKAVGRLPGCQSRPTAPSFGYGATGFASAAFAGLAAIGIFGFQNAGSALIHASST